MLLLFNDLITICRKSGNLLSMQREQLWLFTLAGCSVRQSLLALLLCEYLEISSQTSRLQMRKATAWWTA